MERVGRDPGSDPRKGNRNKRIRIEVGTRSIGELAAVINAKADADVPRSALRLPVSDLNQVSSAHVLAAVEALQAGVEYGFDDSPGYDLVTMDGERFPPEAVFGLAASAALGFPVQPVNFTGGADTVCFDVLRASGWEIIKKDAPARSQDVGLSGDDREWAEGDEIRLTHLRRERHAGVAKAKKSDMRRLHGKLFCERCRLDPVEVFASLDGEACIEVHHRDIQIADMGAGHRTRLNDVECLCANCHRVIHRKMKTDQNKDRSAGPA